MGLASNLQGPVQNANAEPLLKNYQEFKTVAAEQLNQARVTSEHGAYTTALVTCPLPPKLVLVTIIASDHKCHWLLSQRLQGNFPFLIFM